MNALQQRETQSVAELARVSAGARHVAESLGDFRYLENRLNHT